MSAITLTAPTSPVSSLKRLLARRPLLSYFVIAFAGVWIPLLVPVLARNGLGLLPFTVSDIAFVLLFIPGTLCGPTLGAFVVTAATDGKAGVRRLLRRYVQWRVGIHWYLLILLGYPALDLLNASIWLGAAPVQAFLANWPLLFTSYLPLVLAMVLFPAFLEEPGWRGFALPRLEQKFGPLPGSLILGLLHGTWHLPVFLLTIGPAAMGPFNFLGFVRNTFMIMVLTIVWTWVFNNANGSILIAMLLHAASNATGNFSRQIIPALPMPMAGWTADGLFVVCALLIIVFTRGRLSYKPNLTEAPTDPASSPGMLPAQA